LFDARIATECRCHRADGAMLSVSIKDLRNGKGELIFGVFTQADGFPNVEAKSVYWE
jgi:uncharacterized protein (DUF2141 family)